jgi:hypothetical protein
VEGHAGLVPYWDDVHAALQFDPKRTIASFTASPSFGAPWMLSVHRKPNGTMYLRVTRIDRHAWRSLASCVQHCQVPNGYGSQERPSETPIDVSVPTIATERPIDRKTAQLFVILWRTLTRGVEVVDSDEWGFHGINYHVWQGGRAGTTWSPRFGSVLEKAAFIADRLRRLVEAPVPEPEEEVAFLREEMRATLNLLKQRQPCQRLVRER